MRRLTSLILLGLYIMVILSTTGCQVTGKPIQAGPNDAVVPKLSDANTGFSLDLFEALLNKEPNSNIFISPASISLALAMTYNGAKGETALAMAKALGLEGMSSEEINAAYHDLRKILDVDDPEVQLDIANSLWMRKGLEFYPEFLEKNREVFNAEIAALDFNQPDAASTINRWVEQQTNGKITDLVSAPIDPAAVLFLINAIYFNADWATPFNPSFTKDQPFELLDGGTKELPLMFRTGTMPYLEGEEFQAVGLPYGDTDQLSMYVFLPDKDSDLSSFYKQLTPTNWNKWLAAFSDERGSLGLPRFKLEYEVSLNEALTELGMGIAFEQSADFSGMRPTPPSLNISAVKHKSYISVDEKGTEAAAATSVTVYATSAPLNNFDMTIDRPFFFTIVDNESGTILFMGSIVNPE